MKYLLLLFHWLVNQGVFIKDGSAPWASISKRRRRSVNKHNNLWAEEGGLDYCLTSQFLSLYTSTWKLIPWRISWAELEEDETTTITTKGGSRSIRRPYKKCPEHTVPKVQFLSENISFNAEKLSNPSHPIKITLVTLKSYFWFLTWWFLDKIWTFGIVWLKCSLLVSC